MDVTEVKNCRICMCELEDSNFFSVDLIGWEYMTYKEMFEKSLGYKILPNEDQQFCFMCAGRLVKWEEFKSMCQKTQEIIAPVKDEEEELHSETIWYADPDDEGSMVLESDTAQKGEHAYGMAPKDDQQVFGETYKLVLKCFIREFYMQRKPSYSLETFESSSVDKFMHEIWLCAKPHLKREIVYHGKGQTPVWHDNEFPQEEDIERFVSFKRCKRVRTKPSVKIFMNWVKNPPKLILHPYGKHVQTREQWKKAQSVLINIKEPISLMELLQNCVQAFSVPKTLKVPKESNIDRELISFGLKSSVENFIGEQLDGCLCTNKFFYQRFYMRTLKDLLDQLWSLIKRFIIREIHFPDGVTPTWDLLSFARARDLSKFVEIRDDTSSRIYEIEDLKMDLLKTWEGQTLTVGVFPYSKNVKTAALWEKVVPFLEKKTKDEPLDEDSIKELAEKLKEHHGQKFLEVYDESWKMWAHYIACFGQDQHELLIKEAPPTQLLRFFEITPYEFSLSPIITKTTRSKYSFEAVVLWKQAKYSQNHIALGKFKITGDSLADLKHSIWEQSRPFVMREVLFNEEGDPEWSPKVTPTEEDLSKFVSIVDTKRKKPFILSASTIKQCKNNKTLMLYIYQFTSAITTYADLQRVNNTLLPLENAAGIETQNLIEYTEQLIGEKLVSFHINWRMWAHCMKGIRPSEYDNLIAGYPPVQLEHLFVKVSVQDLYKELLDEETNLIENEYSEQEEEEVEDDKPLTLNERINELLQITDETDRNQLKQCPFTGCTSVIKISSFHSHFKYCRYNPDLKLIYPCKFKGCKRSYGAKWGYNQHVQTCQFNPNRKTNPAHQCPYCTATPQNINTHIRRNHSKNRYICDICGTTRKTKGELKVHILSVHNPVMLKCDQCPSEFKFKKTLDAHIARGHSEKPQELNFKCEQCTYASYNRYALLRHMKIRHDPTHKKFICEECNKALSTKTLLRKHLLIHADTEFACNICNHVSKTQNGLKSHMTLHEEMKYECPVCQLKRRSAYEVRMHCKRKHPNYKLPPKGTIMKKTSRFNGKQMTYFMEDDDDSNV